MYHQHWLKFEVQGTLTSPHTPCPASMKCTRRKNDQGICFKRKHKSCRLPGADTKNKAFYGKDDPWLQKVSCCQDYDLKVSLCFLCSPCATSLAACTRVRNWPSLVIANNCGAPEKEATRSTHLRTCNILHTVQTFSWDLKRSIGGFQKFRDLTACTLYDMSHGMLLGELLLLGRPSLTACR